MAHDLTITGGTVVDGTGAPPRAADVAVDGDRITEVAEPGTLGWATRNVDAEGRIVTPGFVDIHTHLDAQLSWDPKGTSSCWHGVTSVVMGNCGVTFAPCRPPDRRYLAEMMESVEDIPADAIMDGLGWDWESYGGFLDALDRMPKGLNAGGMVGHAAVRYHAMGPAAVEDDEPDADQLAAMVALVDEALGAGALGFSSSRTLIHKGPDGRPIPGTFATAAELGPLVEVLGHHDKGIFETAPMIGGQNNVDDDGARAEVALLADLSRRSGRPVSFGLTHTWATPEMHRVVLAAVAAANAEGADLRPQTTVRSVGVLFGLVHNTPWDGSESWAAMRELSLDEKLARIRDPEARRRLIEEAEERGDRLDPAGMFPIVTEPAEYRYDPEVSLAAEAQRRGTSAAEAYLCLADETDGRALLNWPFLNQDPEAVAELLADPNMVLGLADAGAHVGQIMDASQPTWFLTHWVRDLERWDLAEGVRRLTGVPADIFSIPGRGVLSPGSFADLNVIDLDNLSLPIPDFAHDFPGGAGRWVQGGRGYDLTMVNGTVTIEGDEHTGELPGRVLRSATDG